VLRCSDGIFFVPSPVGSVYRRGTLPSFFLRLILLPREIDFPLPSAALPARTVRWSEVALPAPAAAGERLMLLLEACRVFFSLADGFGCQRNSILGRIAPSRPILRQVCLPSGVLVWKNLSFPSDGKQVFFFLGTRSTHFFPTTCGGIQRTRSWAATEGPFRSRSSGQTRFPPSYKRGSR